MTAIVVRVALSTELIDLAEHEALVGHRAAGAVVGFAGVVRDHDGGRHVTRLEYSSHPTAEQTLIEVADEIALGCHGVRAIAVSHRIGTRSIRDVRTVGGHGQGAVTGVEAPVLRRRLRGVGRIRLTAC
jgi:molybdopterin synthase catalytic subunit